MEIGESAYVERYLSCEEIAEHEATMQAAITALLLKREQTIFLRRIYHEAPNDVFELIIMQFSDVDETGGMNVLRRVCKRLMRVVESCATRLTYQSNNGQESFPLTRVALRRCHRIEYIICNSY